MTTITLPRATVEQALEALEWSWGGEPMGTLERDAITALRAALTQRAEPVEPYCYVYEYDGVFGLHREFYPFPYNGMKPSRTVPVYTTPPQQAEPVQEQDAELSAALGWPGGISNPVLDRKVLLQKVAALAQQAEPVEPVEPVATHRINSWGFCGVCRHDRIPGEGCARQECPDSPQQAEPVEPVALKHRHEWFRTGGMEPDQFRCIHCGVWGQEQSDPQIEDRLARHGIPKP